MKNAIWVVLAAVLFGAIGFWGGVTYQKTQSPSSMFAGGRFGGSNSTGGRTQANIATGTVMAQDASSLTIKTASGGSKTVFISAQTEVSKQAVLKAADIKVGDQVGAFGDATNGGITARMIQIVPPGGSFRFGGVGGPRPGGLPGGPGGNQGPTSGQ
jgi:hypothetical protein